MIAETLAVRGIPESLAMRGPKNICKGAMGGRSKFDNFLQVQAQLVRAGVIQKSESQSDCGLDQSAQICLNVHVPGFHGVKFLDLVYIKILSLLPHGLQISLSLVESSGESFSQG